MARKTIARNQQERRELQLYHHCMPLSQVAYTTILGLHMGQADPGFGVFSSISAIKSDLGITPAL